MNTNPHQASPAHVTPPPQPSTGAHAPPVRPIDQIAVPARAARAGLWLLPIYGALTLLATLTHQPDPATDFGAWSRYVTTDRFYASHLVASILGLGLGTLGVVALGVLLAGGRRPKAALTAISAHVLGASGVFALFGLAAFAQPAMGRAFLDGQTAARGWYDAMFNQPTTLVPALVALLIFSAAAPIMSAALAADRRVPRWAVIAFAAAGPMIGLFGVAVGLLQPIGSALLVISGSVIAARLTTGEVATGRRP